jgi:hypothetical protein
MHSIYIGIPPSQDPVTVPAKVFAFAMHDHKGMVYTFSDSPEDRETLANLVRTGDVIKLVYGHEMSLDINTTVRISGGSLRIEHSDEQG